VASAGDSLELKADGLKSKTEPTRWLIVLSVAALLVGVVGLVGPRVVGARDELAPDRQAVLTRASDFAVTFNTYSVNDWAGYQKRVKALVTPRYKKQFLEITNAILSVVKDKGRRSGDVKVLSQAVDRIDKDSAVVIIAFDTTLRTNDSKQAVTNRFRWAISLQKLSGKWLVSESDAVPAMQASIADVTKGG
jgi:Mce-associated membrane protein